MESLPKYICLFIFCLFVNKSISQKVSLSIILDTKNKELTKLNYQKKHLSKNSAIKEIDQVLLYLKQKGYLLATCDSIKSDSNKVTGIINENKKFTLAYLKLGNLNPDLASKIGISEKLFLNKAFNYDQVVNAFEKIIRHYESNGYPFTVVSLDSIIIEHETLKAVLNIKKNKLFKIDSIKIIGTSDINKRFLYRYLSLKENMPYNESLLKSISKKIIQLPFIDEKKVLEVRLTDKINKLYLFLDKKNASQFDGILGFLPDAISKKTVITGDLKLKLINGVFKNGETFDLEWRRLQSQTQDFKGQLIYPFLFGTPLGIDYSLKIYRKDTTFIDINHNIGINYYYSGPNYLKLFYKQRNSNLISTRELNIISTLPNVADITTKSFGIGLFYENLDYRFNPRKGIMIVINCQNGTREIKRNLNINEQAYKDILMKSSQNQFELTNAYYIPIKNNHVLKFNIQAAGIFGNSVIFKNELYRIGGLKTLRGFDEESIYASGFIIPTLEYRFLFAKNSNLLVFVEGAWYENNSINLYLNDKPVSFGAGINIDTKAGILSLNYAIGNQFNNGFDSRSGKIHFGLTALF